MKKTKTCPKCGGHSIYSIPIAKGTQSLLHGRLISIRGLMLVKHVELERYVCAACGFSEEYVSPDGLETLSDLAESGKVKMI